MVGDVHFGRGNVSVAHFFRWISHPGPIASTESSTESSTEASTAQPAAIATTIAAKSTSAISAEPTAAESFAESVPAIADAEFAESVFFSDISPSINQRRRRGAPEERRRYRRQPAFYHPL